MEPLPINQGLAKAGARKAMRNERKLSPHLFFPNSLNLRSGPSMSLSLSVPFPSHSRSCRVFQLQQEYSMPGSHSLPHS